MFLLSCFEYYHTLRDLWLKAEYFNGYVLKAFYLVWIIYVPEILYFIFHHNVFILLKL